MGLEKIYLPELGEGVMEGEIIKIHVSEGSAVDLDQPLLELMTDKASMELPSSLEGVIQQVKISAGDIVPVGAELFVVETGKSSDSGKQKGSKKAFSRPSASAKPSLSSQSVEGDSKKAESNKSPTGNAGRLQAEGPAGPLPEEAQTTGTGGKVDPLAGSLPEGIQTAEAKGKASLLADSLSEGTQKILAIPATKKLARELGISLKEVQGSGSQAEITRQDLIDHIKSRLKGQAPLSPLSQDFEEAGREPVRGLRRFMFDSMTLSKASIPHFTIQERAEADRLIALRTEIKAQLEPKGLKTGYLPFFIKALLPSLKEFPVFNSVYDPQSREIVFKKDINIGFAVDSPQGLLVPVLKQAQNKSLKEIIQETQELAEKGRQGLIDRESLTGAGITLTNMGGLGGLGGTPIINPPEMAIIGIYRMDRQAVLDEKGEWEERVFINFSLTCDHRFIDGATAIRFLKSFMAKIEEPCLLLLE